MCKKAAEFAKDVFPITLEILEAKRHSYDPDLVEPIMWNYLKSCELKRSQPFYADKITPF